MRPTITPANPATTRERIAEVEKRLGLRFPDAYVAFLLAVNGGDPSPEGYRAASTAGEQVERIGAVDTFFAVDAAKEHHDLAEVGETLADLLPIGFLPIAHDYAGDVICLSCEDGSIWLWEEERSAVTRLAVSLDDWLDGFVAASLADDEALRRALREGALEDARSLLDRGVRVDGAVAMAVGGGHKLLAELLLARGEPLAGALTTAAATGRIDLFDWLLAAGADIDEQMDELVGTPLMVAAGNGAVDVVAALLARGANPTARTPTGQTAHDRAVHNEHFDVAALLQERTHS